jgi:hypothetical protein
MIKKIIVLTGLIVFFYCKLSSGQNISKIKITNSYSDFLDAVFLDIGTKYHVKYSYDWNTIHQYSLTKSFTNAPLDSVMNIICDQFHLKYHFDDDILIVEKIKEYINPDNPQANTEFIDYNDKKIYFGVPSKLNFTLSGKVKDQTNGEALPYAIVGIPGTSISSVTNTDGYFTLLKVPSDTSTLTISYMGYRTRKFFLSPEIAKGTLVIEILPASTQLSAVEVKGQREELMRRSDDVSVVQISPKKIESLPSLGEKDIMRSLQLMPGVTGSKESSSGLYVRGGTPDQNLILYDGFTVYHVDHLYGFFSAFNSNAIKDVQLYKGGFESRFGGRLSSVTEITGKDGNQKNFNFGGDISLLSFNAYIETPIGKKITILVAGRKSWKGPLYNKIFDEFNKSNARGNPGGGYGSYGNRNSNATTVTSYFYDLNSKITYRPTDKDVISLSLYNGTDDLNNSQNMSAPSFLQSQNISFSSDNSDLTKSGNIGGSLKWSRKWSDYLYGNTLISYSNYYYDRNRSNSMSTTNSSGETTSFNSGTIENNNLKDYSFKSDYQYDYFKNNKIEFGGFYTFNNISYNYSQNDTTTILDRRNYGVTVGGYLQDKIQLFKDKFFVLPGIRFTYYSPTTKTYTEPRLSMNYNLTDKIKIEGAIGQYYQFVNRVSFEDILAGNSEMWLLSNNSNVPVASATHYILGPSYETNNYLFSVEGYYKRLQGLTEYTLRISPHPGNTINYDENFYNGSNYSRGIEFLAQKKAGNLNGWISYTLGQSMDNYSAFSSKAYSSDQDVRHEFHFVGMYKIKRWEFSLTWIYATGSPYTAPEGGYTLVMLGGNTKDYINVGDKNSLRLPDYHRLDIAANFRILNHIGRDIGYIGVSIFNVYNRQNVWYKQYQIVNNEIIETNVNYLGITPNLTLSFKMR